MQKTDFLGQNVHVDPRSEEYKFISDKIPAITLSRFSWKEGPTPFQGKYPTCVAHAFQNEFRCQPDIAYFIPSIKEMYDAARARGESEGRIYKEGTTITDMADVCKKKFNVIEKYFWILGKEDPQERLNDLLVYLAYYGAVIASCSWYEGMSKELAEPTGKFVGGHAFLILGFDLTRKYLICQNSYGRRLFGQNKNNLFMLSFDSFKKLFKSRLSELCCPFEYPKLNYFV